MSRFIGVVGFELRYWLRRMSTWVYFLLFFGFAFLFVHLAGGAWDRVQVSMGGAGGSVLVNSPYGTAGLTMALALFGVLVTAAILGHAASRDFLTETHPLFFTTPISRSSYLGGRFIGAFLANALIMVSVPIGLLLGALMPYMDRERFGPIELLHYVHPYFVLLVPNLLLTGLIFFALAALTRRMLANYVGGAAMLLGYLMAQQFLSDMENERLAAFLDPFGSGPFQLVTRYWTPAEKNTLLVPLTGAFLVNRLFWIGLAVVVFAVAFYRFRMEHPREEGKAKLRVAEEEAEPVRPIQTGTLPKPRLEYGLETQLRQYLSLVRRSFWGIVANRYFFGIIGAAVIYLFMMADPVNELYGTTTWPVTYAVIEVLGGSFWLFLLIVIAFYGGELVWAEREARMHQVVDATPMPSWVPFAAKLTALSLMVAVMQLMVLIGGIILQASKGYYNFEFGLYAKTLLGFWMLDLVLLAAMVMAVHVLVNQKYLGHFIVIAFLVFTSFMGAMGFEHVLYQYSSGEWGPYSDMNRFGPFLERFFWLKGYWLAWALILAVLTNLFWVRGEETGARWRIRMARLRYTRPALAITAISVALVLGLGGFVFYNTNVLNEYVTSYEREALQAEYEKKYKRFQALAQPRVVSTRVRMEIYPEERDLVATGELKLLNRTQVPIDSLLVLVNPELDSPVLELDRGSRVVLEDEDVGLRMLELERPLEPGDSLTLAFELPIETRGFGNQVGWLQIVENGTFFSSMSLPQIGYMEQGELSDAEIRRKHGLAPKPRMAAVTDTVARRNTYISSDADWMDFEAVIGTSADQIALAPGYLQREWVENGRRYFHYAMDAPILDFYSVLSARYAVRRDRWRDVAIEIYYHPGHEYNLDRMVEGVKASLEYFTREFGPYPHRQVRILEFPRYEQFAQSFPNTIPYSEAIGFIARVEDPAEDIDYPFYVTAHEVAHQWWAHQAIGANVQGATLLSETLSQYSALMVMEEEFGSDQIHRFLKYELDRYLHSRGFERQKEIPLLLVENQAYIHYNKGAVVMYALKDYIGEERLNAALRSFLDDVRYQQPPYTTSLELYEHLKAATPDSLQYVLEDLFEYITLYDNRAVEVEARPVGDGSYRVDVEVETRKLRADSLGHEQAVAMNDLVDIGIFAAGEGKQLGRPLYLRKHRLTGTRQTVTVEVPEEPARAGVDPYHKLIDRNTGDNVVRVKVVREAT